MSAEMPKISETFEEWASQRGLFRPSREGTVCTNYYDDFVACWQEATRQAMERAAKVCDDAAAALNPPGKRTNQVDRHVSDVLEAKADAIRALSKEPS